MAGVLYHARFPAARECLVTAVAGIYLGNSELAVKVAWSRIRTDRRHFALCVPPRD